MKITVRKDAPTRPFDRHWQFGVGADHASQLLRKDYCEHLKRVHDVLGMRYVRFHGIFCDDMNVVQTFRDVLGMPGTERFREISFRRCGEVYDNVLDCGMKPFVELSFMPTPLAKAEADPHVLYGANTNMPRDLGEWAEFIEAFIRYLLHRYGEEEISQWFFEVWNEPDLFHPFFKGTQEDYFALYDAAARAIKAVCPALRVGGPATSASHWIGNFVRHCRDNDIPVDFVSTHQYSGDAFIGVNNERAKETKLLTPEEQAAANEAMLSGFEEGTPLLTILQSIFTDPTASGNIDRDIFPKNAAIARTQADGLPLIYDEWNLSATFSSYYNDTRKQAAYIVRTALNMEGLTEGTCIWCVSDIFEELHQFSEEFHGGFGFISQGGVEKPTFYALKMLAQAGDRRKEVELSGDGAIEGAAFERENETQVLLFRQSMSQEELPHEEAAVHIELDEKPKGVLLQRIDADHCNPLAQWESMGSPHDMTRKELAALREASGMVDEIPDYTWSDGMLTCKVSLSVNDIYFLRVIK